MKPEPGMVGAIDLKAKAANNFDFITQSTVAGYLTGPTGGGAGGAGVAGYLMSSAAAGAAMSDAPPEADDTPVKSKMASLLGDDDD